MSKDKELKIPILITKNDKNLDLSNGDRGWLFKDMVRLEDGRELPSCLLPSYEYAYALSVHKSQGSEYEEALIVLPPGSERFSREILYTAFTRAKSKATLFTDEKTLEAVLKQKTPRLSGVGFKI